MSETHHTSAWSWVTALLALGALVVTVGAQAEFPFTKSLGRSSAEFRDGKVHIVAAYDYSQRHHDSRWLLIQVAASSERPTAIQRDWIALRTADDSEFALATQRRVGEETVPIKQLLQNAATSRHDVVSYFTQRDRPENIQLFTLPFGTVVHDSFVVDNDHVTTGDLFFEAPRGRWESGTYSLVVRHEDGKAALPIKLE
jgi:hypothetical protein